MMEKQCGREEAIDKRGVNWRMMADKLGRDKPREIRQRENSGLGEPLSCKLTMN